MLRSILRTPQFKRDYKRLMKKHCDESAFVEALEALMRQDTDVLKTRYKDDALRGEWKGFREIHIEGDWLLIYRINNETLELVLTRTGSHDDLF